MRRHCSWRHVALLLLFSAGSCHAALLCPPASSVLCARAAAPSFETFMQAHGS
jgi:hypothetical protein